MHNSRQSGQPSVWARLQSLGRPEWFVDFPSSYTQVNKPMTIGRNPTSTLCLTDNLTVSNKHIVLEQKLSDKPEGRVVVLHESSSNGTVVNGVQYQKGQTLELTPGSEICFPCEDTSRKLDFTFEFHVLPEDEGSEKKRNEILHPTAEWALLQEQCDELAREAARLTASVFSNSDKLRQFSDTLETQKGTVKFKDPLENAARGMLALLKLAEERLRSLGDSQTADSIDHRKWEATLSQLGVTDIHLSGTSD